MTEQIDNAIKTFKDYKENGYDLRTSNAELFELAIRSLQAWEEVIEELEKEIDLYENSKSIMGCNDFDIECDGAMKGLGKAIEVIKQKLAEIEEGEKDGR